MLRKTITLLTCFFLLQFLASCLFGCNCPQQEKRPAKLEAFEASISQKYILKEDSTYSLKELFLKFSLMAAETEPVAYNLETGTIGFSQVYACDCPPPYYYFTNSIDSVSIKLISSDSTALEISDWFYESYDSNNPETMNEYFQTEHSKINYALYVEQDFKLDASMFYRLPASFNLEINLLSQGTAILNNNIAVEIRPN